MGVFNTALIEVPATSHRYGIRPGGEDFERAICLALAHSTTEACRLDRISPWDLCAILLHARHRDMFPDGLPLQPWAAELRKQRLAEHSKDHPDAHCLPLNPIQLHSHPQARKIIQTPGLVLILYEANDGIRQIFTDGRPLPDNNDADPWWYGYSIGKWEGDTLVVQTIGFKDQGWIDEEGTPNTNAARLTERFRRLNYGTLEIEITVDDPKTFTRPWSFKLDQRLMPDTELIEFVCLENNTSLKHLVGQ